MIITHPPLCFFSSSSTRSKKTESQVNLKVASVIVEQGMVKVYQTRSRAQEQAKRKKDKLNK